MANRDLTNWREASVSRPLWSPLFSFRREMDRLFDDFLPSAENRRFGGRNLQPDIEIKENDGALIVSAELPGIDQKDIQVGLDDNVLSIRGEKREQRSENDRGRHYTERSYGQFERRIALEQEVDASKIEARFNNGVLTVTLPKTPSAQTKRRQIEIKS